MAILVFRIGFFRIQILIYSYTGLYLKIRENLWNMQEISPKYAAPLLAVYYFSIFVVYLRQKV